MIDIEPFLLPQHRKLIGDSGITEEVAVQRGYRSITERGELADLGFSSAQRRVPTLLLPVWNVHGEIGIWQARPDSPRVNRGKALKYETPKGSSMVVDVPPSIREQLGDPSVPLIITEGIRKADAAVSHGLCCIALLGVWSWRGTNDHGGKTVLADFESIALNNRDVYLAFDSDVTTKPSVRRALDRLTSFLESRSARVRTLLLPPGEEGAKTGLDDYLVTGHSTDDLFGLVGDPGTADLDAANRRGIYAIVNGCFAYVKRTFLVEEWTPVCNFTAQIVEDIVIDNGSETTRIAVIRGRLATGVLLPEIRIPFDQFDSMLWVSRYWGSTAILNAGNGNRDKVREAIQRFSDTVVNRREYTRAGWQPVDGQWIFLSNGSAIDRQGIMPGVTVHLDGPGELLSLDAKPTDPAFPVATRQSLAFLDLAPDTITVPLLGAAFRAVLNEITYADFSLFLAGPTGVFKSELASLVQSCFGSGFTRLTLPATWAATPNYLERIASDFKDCVLVIDDFAPSGATADVHRYHAVADRVIRGAGNASGRGRMLADSGVRPAYRPRAMIVSTGEDIPKGHSILARMLVLEIEKGTVIKKVLASFQDEKGRRTMTVMMSGFIQWLAPRLDSLRTSMTTMIQDRRSALPSQGDHARAAGMLANLAVAWSLWLDYARETGALSEDQCATTRERVWLALVEVGSTQTFHQNHEHPVIRFLALLRGCLATGDAHVAGPDGNQPDKPAAWGWRLRESGSFTSDTWHPQGSRIGWVDVNGLYLEPQAVYSAVQRHGLAGGTGISISQQVLWKRLDEAGVLCSTDKETRGTRLIRKTLESSRRSVLHVPVTLLEDDLVIAEHGTDGQVERSGGQVNANEPAPDPVPETPQNQGSGGNGRVGRRIAPRDKDIPGKCANCTIGGAGTSPAMCIGCPDRWTA